MRKGIKWTGTALRGNHSGKVLSLSLSLPPCLQQCECAEHNPKDGLSCLVQVCVLVRQSNGPYLCTHVCVHVCVYTSLLVDTDFILNDCLLGSSAERLNENSSKIVHAAAQDSPHLYLIVLNTLAPTVTVFLELFTMSLCFICLALFSKYPSKSNT